MHTYYLADGYSVRCLKETVGSIGALNCGSATVTGNLISGTAASGVSASVPYTVGNGGYYAAQIVSSTGVTGLTANISLGLFANGAGSLAYSISGTPSASGTASFALNVGGQSCALSIVVYGVQPAYPTGSVFCNGATIVNDVTNPTTGRTWMDRNLGAFQVANSVTDDASYGDLFQWGRKNDGHQCRNSLNTATLSSTDQPPHGNFITSSSDWLTVSNNNLWQVSSGTNNPCPSGYRVPTDSEMSSEVASWNSSNPIGAFSSSLKLPYGGFRYNSNGFLGNPDSYIGQSGFYWTGTTNGTDSRYMVFNNSSGNLYANLRSYGISVRCIKELVGTIGSINCGGASTTGTVYVNSPVNGVSVSVPYTGGNSGTHNGQTLSSMGLAGLTATLVSGNFANGSGSLIYNITGITYSSGMAYFLLNIGGKSCTLSLSVEQNLIGQYPTGTIFCNGETDVVDVINPFTGKTWMDRNLGASQVALSSTDSAAYGDLYQWGRRSDGHQCRSSLTTSVLSSSDQPTHSKFITSPNFPYDWLNPQNTNLWQGVNGVNNPCPIGYRLPSITELNDERISWVQEPINSSNNSTGAFLSPLKLTLAGNRDYDNGNLNVVDTDAYYWSNTVFNTESKLLNFNTNGSSIYSTLRVHGFSVRCIKD
jgi:uncharacterized protein (TIGR02145 family)